MTTGLQDLTTGGQAYKHTPIPFTTDGFDFIEFAAPETDELAELFRVLGFREVGQSTDGDLSLFRQGQIDFVLNRRAGFPSAFAAEHGPGACGMGFRVSDAPRALDHALAHGAELPAEPGGSHDLAIVGIGGSRIYLVDAAGHDRLRRHALSPCDSDSRLRSAQLTVVDHLTHNVRKGRMDSIAAFYADLFGFREIRYFDITGEYTGLTSRALTAPCDKLKIPINESKGGDQLDQIAEFIEQYNGEGIQHIALATDDILASYDSLASNGVRFMSPPPDTYYEALEDRLPGHGQPVAELQRRGILLDGSGDGRLLLQIFTETCIGPIFFEIIQRKGDEGFGEGNFKALFESMERDQIRRGVLQHDG